MMKKFLPTSVIIIIFTLFLWPKQILAQEKTFSYSSFESITPGKTTEQEVLQLLGKPTKDFYSFNKDIFWYLAENETNYQTIIFQNKVVSLVTIHIPPDKAENLSGYGLPDKSTFNYYRYDTKTHIYEDRGLALTADGKGTILVKQKFIPKKATEFLAEWSEDFPEANPYYEGKSEIDVSPSPLPQAPKPGKVESLKNLLSNITQYLRSLVGSVLGLLPPLKS